MHTIIKKFPRGVWFFPVVLAIFFLGLSAFKISGTSVGTYHQIIYGDSAKDPDLLFGHPRPVRSDEWLVDSQITIAQSKAGFPRFNNNLGNGRDMSLAVSVPYKDWSAIFRPHNLAFFVLPLEYAFALKWWLLLYLLIISCYFFTLRILPRQCLFAALFATAIGLSPFFFWWYLSGTFAPMFYGFFIMILGMRVVNGEPVKFLEKRPLRYSYLIYIGALAYLVTSFALILYPPFQIPIAVVVSLFVLSYILAKHFNDKLAWRELSRRVGILLAGLVISLGLIGLFVVSNRSAINAVTSTVYPGARLSSSGGINYLNIFDSFVQPQLESSVRGTHFFNNQSESSNFILLSPFLILPALALTFYEWRRHHRFDWLFGGIQLTVLLLFARIFLPYGNTFFHFMLLDRVPHERLLIGIGLANVLLILTFYKKLVELKVPRRLLWWTASIYGLACFTLVAALGFHISHQYPIFISYAPKILILAGGFCLIICLFLIRRGVLAAGLLLLFSFYSSFYVNPLYRGLGWIKDNDLFSRMQSVSKPGDTWAAADVIVFENFGLLANRDSISGIQQYPDLKLWRQASSDETIYNRYSHVIFVSNPTWQEPLRLIQPDLFEVRISCSDFITKNVDYILDTSELNLTCLKLKDSVQYPAANFHIYQVQP